MIKDYYTLLFISSSTRKILHYIFFIRIREDFLQFIKNNRIQVNNESIDKSSSYITTYSYIKYERMHGEVWVLELFSFSGRFTEVSCTKS